MYVGIPLVPEPVEELATASPAEAVAVDEVVVVGANDQVFGKVMVVYVSVPVGAIESVPLLVVLVASVGVESDGVVVEVGAVVVEALFSLEDSSGTVAPVVRAIDVE